MRILLTQEEIAEAVQDYLQDRGHVIDLKVSPSLIFSLLGNGKLAAEAVIEDSKTGTKLPAKVLTFRPLESDPKKGA